MEILHSISHTIIPTKQKVVVPPSYREEHFFKFQPIGNNNCPCRPCFFTNRDEMKKSYRRPSKLDAFCIILLYFTK